MEVTFEQEEGDDVVVDLRNPYWAAMLAWLLPGAGHLYQRRFGKGFLFMVCILATFFYGLGLGRGRCVYASFKPGDIRWQYVLQAGAGAVTLPAVAQAMVTKNGNDPWFVLCERYPEGHTNAFFIVKDDAKHAGDSFKDGFMAPPAGPIYLNERDTLGQWHDEMKHKFEIGTLFCVVAGLLNLLVIYDAFCGPAILTPEEKLRLEEKKNRKKRRDNPYDG